MNIHWRHECKPPEFGKRKVERRNMAYRPAAILEPESNVVRFVPRRAREVRS